jgi:hypothetical protein
LIARIRLQAAPSAVDEIYSRELKPGISLEASERTFYPDSILIGVK